MVVLLLLSLLPCLDDESKTSIHVQDRVVEGSWSSRLDHRINKISLLFSTQVSRRNYNLFVFIPTYLSKYIKICVFSSKRDPLCHYQDLNVGSLFR